MYRRYKENRLVEKKIDLLVKSESLCLVSFVLPLCSARGQYEGKHFGGVPRETAFARNGGILGFGHACVSLVQQKQKEI